VQASTNGSSFSDAVGSATYTFNPASANTVNITVPGTSARYLRVNITANSGWAAGQVGEFEVYPSGGGSSPAASLSASPSALTFGSQALNTTSAAQAVTISNTGTASATGVGVSVSGDFAQTNNCASTIAAGASCTVNVSFRPTVSGSRTGTLSIAGSAPVTASLAGTGGSTNTNLAAGKPTSESSHNDVYPSSNVTDADQNTYWESANNAFPQWVQVDLGSAQSASRVVLTLPAGWGARNETLAVQGSTDGSTFSTVKAGASYAFDPSATNTVTITFPATTQRYFRLTVTANSGWPAGQISGFQVWNRCAYCETAPGPRTGGGRRCLRELSALLVTGVVPGRRGGARRLVRGVDRRRLVVVVAGLVLVLDDDDDGRTVVPQVVLTEPVVVAVHAEIVVRETETVVLETERVAEEGAVAEARAVARVVAHGRLGSGAGQEKRTGGHRAGEEGLEQR
jgi:hypothetical protein